MSASAAGAAILRPRARAARLLPPSLSAEPLWLLTRPRAAAKVTALAPPPPPLHSTCAARQQPEEAAEKRRSKQAHVLGGGRLLCTGQLWRRPIEGGVYALGAQGGHFL